MNETKKDNKKEENKVKEPTINNMAINNNRPSNNTNNNNVNTNEIEFKNVYQKIDINNRNDAENGENNILELNIENNKLIIKINNKNIDVNGINGNVKRYYYEYYNSALIVITDSGNYFTYLYDDSEDSDAKKKVTSATFNEITNDTGSEIVGLEYYIKDEENSASNAYLSVILSNGEIRKINQKNEIEKLDLRKK